MVGLGDLPGGDFGSVSAAVSADGSVVVGSGSTEAGRAAFYWTQSLGMVNLKDYLIAHGVADVVEWTNLGASGVSADGRTIVGTGTNPMGQTEAWIVTVPEPSAVALAIPAILVVLLCRQIRSGKRGTTD
jgi:hypothetical protein